MDIRNFFVPGANTGLASLPLHPHPRVEPLIRRCGALLSDCTERDLLSFYSVKLTPKDFPEGWPTDFDGHDSVDILIRQVFVDVKAKLLRRSFKAILRGPGGAGKSTTLFMLRSVCQSLGWVVAYIPQGRNLANSGLELQTFAFRWLREFRSTNSTLLPQILCQSDPRFKTLDDVVSIELSNDTAVSRWSLLISELRMTVSHRVLIAVDQWNAIASVDGDLAAIFQKFSTFSMQNGSFVVAVSSSFYAVPHLDDGDSLLDIYVDVPRYSDAEFREYFSLFQSNGMLTSDDTYEDVAFHTGRVPRLVATFFGKKSMETWSSSVVQYYEERIRRALTKLDSGDQATFIVSFLRYGSVQSSQIPILWQTLGLTVKSSENMHEPICPAVTRAALNVLQRETVDLVRQMLHLSNGSLTGQIFEIWVCNMLRSGRGKIPIGHNLCGEWDNNEAFVDTGLLQPIYMQHGALKQEVIVGGNLYICRQNFPVIDFAFKVNGVIYLVQASIQSYSQHDTKIDDLHEKTVKVVGEDECTIWNLFTFGSSACELKNLSSKKVRYVYITSSNATYTKRLKSPLNQVTLIHGPLLSTCLGTSWPGNG